MDYKGQLKNFPVEVVEKMLERQFEQRGERNVWMFEKNCCNGFEWASTPEGVDFWEDVICKENFKLFFEKYPKNKNIHENN